MSKLNAGKDGVNMFRRTGLIMQNLTNRELEIMRMTTEGMLSPEEIAEKLFITVRTVRFHIDNINKKYDSNSFTRSVLLFVKENEIDYLERAMFCDG